MSAIEGVRCSMRDALWLVERLQSVGRAEDVIVSKMIEIAVTTGYDVAPLESVEKDAVLAVLDDPPAGLAELRTVLATERRRRAGD